MEDVVIELNDENFQTTINNADKPVMIDFWATWCGPCRMQSPIFHEFANNNKDKAVFAKVNVDENEKIAMALRIEAIPTIILVSNGVVKEVNVGLATDDKLAEILSKNL